MDRTCLRIFRRLGIAVGAALLACTVAALLAGKGPGVLVQSYWLGAFGRAISLADTVAKTAPLIFSGLALAVSMRCGLFNIGAEGQMLLGGAAGAAFGIFLPPMPGWLHLPLVLTCGAAAGALMGMIPGLLKAFRGVHEVVVTIMLNYVAIHLCRCLLAGPMRGELNPVGSDALRPSAHMPVLWRAGAVEVTWAIVLALAACGAVWWWLAQTPGGWRMKAVGGGRQAALLAGLPVKRTIVTAMTVSGALAGLGGAIHVAGIATHTFTQQFTPGYGFEGIAVSVLAGNHPLWLAVSAFAFASLKSAQNTMQTMAGVPAKLTTGVQGLIILAVSLDLFRRTRRRRRTTPIQQEHERELD